MYTILMFIFYSSFQYIRELNQDYQQKITNYARILGPQNFAVPPKTLKYFGNKNNISRWPVFETILRGIVVNS